MKNATLPYGFAKSQGILISTSETEQPKIIIREGADLTALAEVRRNIGTPMQIKTVPKATFELHLSETYSNNDTNAAEVVADVGQEIDLSQLITELPAVEDLLDTQDDAPIIRMINALLTQAVRQGASDVHIEPYERNSVVRFRCDGVLVDVAQPHRALHAVMASRIKIMASLDISEKRLPQDGRIALKLAGRQVDVRVSTLPTTHGERIVLRLLDKGNGQRTLDSLGMAESTVNGFTKLLEEPHGIVLVTGPTGSGKSTTLYAALQGMDALSLNIVTAEDPVEYDLPGIGQIQVNTKISLSFARVLRAILRQDPDVIMIGEIRDLETAQIAVQASLTGHLVLASLHTNDAASAITRLVDMGIEPFLLSSTLRGVLAQRLVRKLCSKCKVPYEVTAADTDLLVHPIPQKLWKAAGCPECSQSGYGGRTGVYELIVADEPFQRLIHNKADESALREYAIGNGSSSLRTDGNRLLAEGVTSIEELLRVTRE
ncbi:type II secretion system ATPase GspE [Methylophilus sp. 3sh_L]|uniref:type II secretion system ATPase GspE n=1 Tax=Methylophilus sp. 3sh_L TaxID=3377114 RepID=UPI00398E6859